MNAEISYRALLERERERETVTGGEMFLAP
jgi:hypothetical protein